MGISTKPSDINKEIDKLKTQLNIIVTKLHELGAFKNF